MKKKKCFGFLFWKVVYSREGTKQTKSKISWQSLAASWSRRGTRVISGLIILSSHLYCQRRGGVHPKL